MRSNVAWPSRPRSVMAAKRPSDAVGRIRPISRIRPKSARVAAGLALREVERVALRLRERPYNEPIKSRKRLWIVIGALCALAVGIGYLARPVDEFAVLRSLQPRNESVSSWPGDSKIWTFEFDGHSKEQEVIDSLPISRRLSDYEPVGAIVPQVTLPSGNGLSIFFWDYSRFDVEIHERHPAPWYQRALATIKHRLGP